jgi:hypothetical protein
MNNSTNGGVPGMENQVTGEKVVPLDPKVARRMAENGDDPDNVQSNSRRSPLTPVNAAAPYRVTE